MIADSVESSTAEGMAPKPAMAFYLGLLMLGLYGMAFIAIVLGIAAVFQRNAWPVFEFTGIALSGLCLSIMAVLNYSVRDRWIT